MFINVCVYTHKYTHTQTHAIFKWDECAVTLSIHFHLGKLSRAESKRGFSYAYFGLATL